MLTSATKRAINQSLRYHFSGGTVGYSLAIVVHLDIFDCCGAAYPQFRSRTVKLFLWLVFCKPLLNRGVVKIRRVKILLLKKIGVIFASNYLKNLQYCVLRIEIIERMRGLMAMQMRQNLNMRMEQKLKLDAADDSID